MTKAERERFCGEWDMACGILLGDDDRITAGARRYMSAPDKPFRERFIDWLVAKKGMTRKEAVEYFDNALEEEKDEALR